MKKYSVILSILFAVILPSVLLGLVNPKTKSPESKISKEKNESVKLEVNCDGTVVEFDPETYIASVIFGEMPADFDMEALKAQAVAVRTYTLRRLTTGSKHDNAEICTDPSCCQAFRKLDDSVHAQRCIQATQDTAGQVLTFEGKLIEATYFSCSGGRTEAAEEVWGADVPYLQSVESPGEEGAIHFQDTLVLSKEEFFRLLDIEPVDRLPDPAYTTGGGVKVMDIGDRSFSGTELRNLLDLRSTAIYITEYANSFLITTKGFGHRVGMSQYGAEAMAITGSDYREILAYYYQGAELKQLSQNELFGLFDKAVDF